VWIVTGASGFVGGHVLSALERKGAAVGLYRAPGAGRHVGVWDVEHLKRALDGATGVVHAASVVHRPGTPAEELIRFNVEGTRALVEAARAVGVRRIIFLSSIKVHGERTPSVIDEHTAIAAETDYARTKARAERIVLAATDLQPIILRLCPVYGRGDKGNVRTMIRAIWRRRFFIPGDGLTRKSIVHVSTVADVISAASESRVSGTYVVADRETPSIRDLADCIARALGRPRPIAVPKRLLRGVAAFVGHAAHLLGRSTSISAELIDKATTSSVCDPSKVERDLGVVCHADLERSIREEVAWLRESKLL
jgi:nucleoside-diphosphate-sugar epimerase